MNEVEEEKMERELSIVKNHVEELARFFDNVQVFCTYHSEGTININWGHGNWFARYGQICEWEENFDLSNHNKYYDTDIEDKDSNLIDKHVAQLSEHFEAVQLFVSKQREGTYWINHGSGNIFARYGQVKKWLFDEETEE